ncbi:hypothetical protein B0I35DRAFT_133353 [Stachybotrys elegans]|uniref:Uncharacterized protein n=1 Tax=Stachybotrys elegans TaxID=80388 RepID=A0A8K0T598_9HYPO|nr:hypothetical protein B0I35DRAFT_133353 [Stachybotrys elegans]
MYDFHTIMPTPASRLHEGVCISEGCMWVERYVWLDAVDPRLANVWYRAALIHSSQDTRTNPSFMMPDDGALLSTRQIMRPTYIHTVRAVDTNSNSVPRMISVVATICIERCRPATSLDTLWQRPLRYAVNRPGPIAEAQPWTLGEFLQLYIRRYCVKVRDGGGPFTRQSKCWCETRSNESGRRAQLSARLYIAANLGASQCPIA